MELLKVKRLFKGKKVKRSKGKKKAGAFGRENEEGRVKNLFKGKKVKKRLAPWKGKTKSEK